MTWFVRVGPRGMAYGPFASEAIVKQWLTDNGFDAQHEGVTFQLYAAHDPSLYTAHVAMRPLT